MRLNSLRLSNFRQHADTAISFESGITSIIGPNGAGKSTLLEAIAWALYGNPAARGNKDSIPFLRAPGRVVVRVELEFELGRHRYRIVREPNKAEFYLDGSAVPIANSIRGVSELVQRRLGMSREEFFKTYFTGQKELNVMAAMTAPQRAQFLSRVLGYEKLRDAQELAISRRREIVATSEGLRSGMPNADNVAQMLAEASARLDAARVRAAEADRRREESESNRARVTPRWVAAQAERDLHLEIQGELRVAENEAASFARDAERVAREIAEVTAARDELDRIAIELVPLGAIAAELQEVEELYREESRRKTLLDTERAVAEEMGRLAERLAKIENAPTLEEQVTEELEKKRHELDEAEGRLEARRTEWVRDTQEADTKRQALRSQYAELKVQRERLVAAGENGICPTCARPLGGHFRTVLDLLDSQLETVRVDGNYFRNRLEQLTEMPEDVKMLDERRRATFDEVGKLERRLAKVQHAVQELGQLRREVAAKEQRQESLRTDLDALPVGYDSVRHDQLKEAVNRLRPLGARADRLGALLDREPQIRQQEGLLIRSTLAVQNRLKELRERREQSGFSQERFAALRTEHERTMEMLRIAEFSAMSAEKDAEAARNDRLAAERHRADLVEKQRKLQALQQEQKLHEELDRAFRDLRTDLNFQLRPEISELASAFLSELTDSRYSEIELDDQYNVVVLEDGVQKPVISGGEEDLANLVLRLAISQMIAERAGQSFSLLILDEVFGSLDEARRIHVVELLRKLGDRFDQIVLITHIESVRDGVDHVITVRYDESTGASQVEQSDTTLSLPFGGTDVAAD